MSRLQRKRGRKSNYVHALNKNEDWIEVKRLVLIRDRNCRICSSKLYLETHHLTYYADGKSIVGKEINHLDKMLLLCAKCHKLVHKDKKHPMNPKNYKNGIF